MKESFLYSDSVYEEAELRANKFNLIFTGALVILEVLALVLDLLKVFVIPLQVILPVLAIAFVLFVTPFVVFIIHDKILKKEITILKWKKFKRCHK